MFNELRAFITNLAQNGEHESEIFCKTISDDYNKGQKAKSMIFWELSF